MRIIGLVCLSGLVCLTGCFRHCDRAHPYSLCQTDLSQNVQAAFDTGSVVNGELCGEKWWTFFQDPQLDHLIELGLACNPSIHIADARIRLACEEAKIARSALLPHIFGVGDIARQKVSTTGPGFVPGFPDLFTDTTLKLTTSIYELDIWQKNRSIYYAALDEVQATQAEYVEAKLLLSTTIAAVYFDLQMKLSLKEVTKERLAARKELYALHRQQFNLGIISEFRLYQTDNDVRLLQDALFELDAEVDVDVHALTALVGNGACPGGELTVAPAAQFNTPFPLPATLPIDLLARRPDVNAQRWRVEAACFGIKAAKANFFPRIDLLGWLGTQSIFFDRLFRGDTLIALAEGAATLPLFVAGKLRAELGVAREDLEIAIEAYNQTILNAVQQVSDALSNLETSNERKVALELAIADAKNLLDLTTQRFDQGINTKLSVLNAVENWLAQKDLAIQVQLVRFESAVDLIRAIGGGYYACP